MRIFVQAILGDGSSLECFPMFFQCMFLSVQEDHCVFTHLCGLCHPVDGQALVKLAQQVKPHRSQSVQTKNRNSAKNTSKKRIGLYRQRWKPSQCYSAKKRGSVQEAQ